MGSTNTRQGQLSDEFGHQMQWPWVEVVAARRPSRDTPMMTSMMTPMTLVSPVQRDQDCPDIEGALACPAL